MTLRRFLLFNQVEAPQNTVWILGFTIFAVYGLANAFYQYGAVGLIVLPLLFPIKVSRFVRICISILIWMCQAAVDVTAFSSFMVGAYSMIKRGDISKYLYGVPLSIGLLITVMAALIPSAIVQLFLAAPLLGYLYFL
jgi:hypothetical protein